MEGVENIVQKEKMMVISILLLPKFIVLQVVRIRDYVVES